MSLLYDSSDTLPQSPRLEPVRPRLSPSPSPPPQKLSAQEWVDSSGFSLGVLEPHDSECSSEEDGETQIQSIETSLKQSAEFPDMSPVKKLLIQEDMSKAPSATTTCWLPTPPSSTSSNTYAHTNFAKPPYFCPIPGCPRAEGGKGFEGKNELIRHALVHDCPGYVCPFCPDREHRYPRADNLQRHVRVHHLDIDKDDPQLWEVLAQPAMKSRELHRRNNERSVFASYVPPTLPRTYSSMSGAASRKVEGVSEADRNSEPPQKDRQRSDIPRAPSKTIASLEGSQDKTMLNQRGLDISIPPFGLFKQSDDENMGHDFINPSKTKFGPAVSEPRFHTRKSIATESDCSEKPTGNSSGPQDNRLVKFLSLFGDELIAKTGARAWAEHTFSQLLPEEFDRLLIHALEKYELVSIARSLGCARKFRLEEAIPVAVSIGGFGLHISRYFRLNATKMPTEEKARLSKQSSTPRSLSAIGYTSSKQIEDNYGPIATENFEKDFEKHCLRLLREDSEIGLEQLYGDSFRGDWSVHPRKMLDDMLEKRFEDALEYATSGSPFQELVINVRRLLYYDDQSQLTEIRTTILNSCPIEKAGYCINCATYESKTRPAAKAEFQCLKHLLHRVTLEPSWKVFEFLQSQFDDHVPDLGKVVTLSGSAFHAYATTCSEYLETMWPGNGKILLPALQAFLNKASLQKDHNTEPAQFVYEDSLVLRVESSQVHDFQVVAYGTPEMLVNLAAQLSWMSAAMSISRLEDVNVSYLKSTLHRVPHGDADEQLRFRITLDNKLLSPKETPCWLSLFDKAVIAYGFPVPEKQDVGMEVPIGLLAALSGARHAVEYEGGIVIKGFSTLLIPTKRTENRVQWHLVTAKDDSRITYHDGLKRCEGRVMLDQFDFESLKHTRAIVGWCSSADTVLGKEEVNYMNIDYSGAQEALDDLRLTGAALGFQQFGLAQLDLALGPKDGKFHIQRTGPYQNIVYSAERTPILLYDTGERRAWLVSAASVMLHIAQHRHFLDPYTVDGKPVSLPVVGSARETLLKHRQVILSDDEPYSFKDMVIDTWSILEYLIDQKVAQDRKPGKKLHSPLEDALFGFEYKAVVENRSPFRQKKCTLSQSSGGWLHLIQDIDALVLFANGFEDLICPNQTNNGLCHIWKTMPRFKDYLATTVKTLLDLYSVSGCRLSREYLTTTRLCWDRGDSCLFEPCPYPRSFRCQCNRLQQIVSKSSIWNQPIRPPGELEPEGAVIFGSAGSFICGISKVKDTAQTAETQSRNKEPKLGSHALYSQPNIALTLPITQYLDETPSSSASKPSSYCSDTTDLGGASETTASPLECQSTPVMDTLNLETLGYSLERKRARDVAGEDFHARNHHHLTESIYIPQSKRLQSKY